MAAPRHPVHFGPEYRVAESGAEMAAIYPCLHFELPRLSIIAGCGREVRLIEPGKYRCLCADIARGNLDKKLIENCNRRGVDGRPFAEFLLKISDFG